MPGWWRSLYGVFGLQYDSINDTPIEKDIKIKQVCMRQISLSKLKLNHVKTKERIPPDLQKIKVNEEFKINYINLVCDDITYITEIKKVKKDEPPTPNNSPWFQSKTRIF